MIADRLMIMFLVPMFTAFFCGVMCLLHYYSSAGRRRARHILLITLAFDAAVLCWLGALLFASGYESFVYYNALFFLILMLNQVLVYHFVFALTGMGHKESFPRAHYVIPLIISVIIAVWSATVPYGTKSGIMQFPETGHPYPVLAAVFTSFPPVFCIYTLLYMLFGLRRVGRYRRAVENHPDGSGRISVRWLYLFVSLVFLSLPIPFAAIIFDTADILTSPLAVIGTLLPVTQYLVVAYNTLSGNYILIEPTDHKDGAVALKSAPLDRARFEKYIGNRKPYLDPKLKITDLAAGLNTNRSYVSNFINREYGMNFNCYINRQRLEELQRLRTSPENKKINNMELALMAGFGSYRSYRRVRTEFAKPDELTGHSPVVEARARREEIAKRG